MQNNKGVSENKQTTFCFESVEDEIKWYFDEAIELAQEKYTSRFQRHFALGIIRPIRDRVLEILEYKKGRK